MNRATVSPFVLVGLITVWPLAMSAGQTKEAPKVKIPQPGVPQIMTMEGRYVRAAYNNEATSSSDIAWPTSPWARSGCSSRPA